MGHLISQSVNQSMSQSMKRLRVSEQGGTRAGCGVHCPATERGSTGEGDGAPGGGLGFCGCRGVEGAGVCGLQAAATAGACCVLRVQQHALVVFAAALGLCCSCCALHQLVAAKEWRSFHISALPNKRIYGA